MRSESITPPFEQPVVVHPGTVRLSRRETPNMPSTVRAVVALFAALISTACVALALGVAPASAGFTAPHPFVSSFDGSGSTAGTFSNIDAVAVSRSSGNVFVYDRGTSSLSQFDSSGAPVAFSDPGLGGASSIALAFADSQGDVAVDNSGTASDGNIYVSTRSFNGDSTVYGFDASGAALSGFPKSSSNVFNVVCRVGVDPAGHLWLSSEGGVGDGLREYDSQGNALGGFLAISNACQGLAFDASGNLYVGAHGRVEKYNADANGNFVPDPDRPVFDDGAPLSGVAVDTASGHVFAAHSSGAPVPGISEYDRDGNLVSEWGSDVVGSAWGVAVNPANGRVYVVDAATQVVDVFDSTFVLDVAVGEPTAVSQTGATLHGTVDPAGEQVTDCHFDFGPTSAYGQSVPCDQTPAEIGAGNGPVAVSADLSGLTPGVTYHYRLSASNADLTSTSADTLLGAPRVKQPTVVGVAKTTATVRAQVNPGGISTSCHVDYVTEAGYDPSLANPYSAGQSAPCSAGLGSASTDVTASADLAGLQPGTTYHARLVATNAAGSTESADAKFSTDPIARISKLRVDVGSPTSADASAEINPLGEQTSYYFEYGTTTAYGNRVPAQPGSVGSGTDDVTVSAHFEGLSAGTTYHVRLVAENAGGITRSADRKFGYYEGGAALPDNRAYEQVTPVEKNGAAFDTGILIAPPRVGDSGDRVMLTTIQCFPGSGACPVNNRSSEGALYSSERTSAGWQTTELTPPVSVFAGSSTRGMLLDSGASVFASSRFNDSQTELVARKGDGTFVTIGPAQAPGTGLRPAQIGLARFSDDLSRSVFGDMASNLGWPFDQTFGDRTTVLEYVGSGNSEPFLVGVTGGRGSTDLIGHCGIHLGPSGAVLSRPVSRDGRTIYVTVEDVGSCPPGTPGPLTDELYARIDESRTVKISARSPEGCTTSSCVSSPASDALFEAASDDGSKALFSSEQQLTDDATDGEKNLYLYDFDRPAGEELTAISVGSQSGDGPDVAGVLAFSADGSRTYFVARGVLNSERNAAGETPTAGANNLYVYRHDGVNPDGRLTFIAQLADGDVHQFGPGSANVFTDVTPTGRVLLFPSRAVLTPDGGSANQAAQIYRYDSAIKELVRVSVGEGGYNNNGDGDGPPPCAGLQLGSDCRADASIPQVTGRAMSRDGEYAFFSSPAALTPGATDHVPTGALKIEGGGEAPYYRQNFYEWHDGHVYLIADGRGAPPRAIGMRYSALLGTDATGKNVFFKSDAALSASDTDNGQRDIYTARVCGDADPCIRVPVTATACAGDACQGSQSGAPAAPVAGTVGFAGPGNAAGRPVKLRATLLTKLARGSRFVVRVRVPAKGRIAVRGAAVKTARRRAARAGTHRVLVRLTRKARRSLARKRKLRIALSVRYAPASGVGSTSRVMLIVSAPKTGGGGR